MKKMISILCACAMILAVGCGSSDSGSDKSKKNVNDLFSSSTAESSSAAESSAAADSSSSAESLSAADSSAADSSASDSSSQASAYDKVDTDLSAMSDTMAYAEMSNMITTPDKYKGKVVKAKGTFAVAEENGNTYFACLLYDSTACCSQPLEFVLKDKRSYPADYPALDSEITVVGVFGTYTEGANVYCQLSDAQLL